jgi:hypothetical protein
MNFHSGVKFTFVIRYVSNRFNCAEDPIWLDSKNHVSVSGAILCVLLNPMVSFR